MLMYQFLDRSTVALRAPDHFLIISARLWTLANTFQRCPCATLAPRFGKIGLDAVLPDFHAVMMLLDTVGSWRLDLGPPCRETIDEGEALLLGLFAAGLAGGTALQRTAEAMAGDAGAAGVLAEAARRVALAADRAAALRDDG